MYWSCCRNRTRSNLWRIWCWRRSTWPWRWLWCPRRSFHIVCFVLFFGISNICLQNFVYFFFTGMELLLVMLWMNTEMELITLIMMKMTTPWVKDVFKKSANFLGGGDFLLNYIITNYEDLIYFLGQLWWRFKQWFTTTPTSSSWIRKCSSWPRFFWTSRVFL